MSSSAQATRKSSDSSGRSSSSDQYWDNSCCDIPAMNSRSKDRTSSLRSSTGKEDGCGSCGGPHGFPSSSSRSRNGTATPSIPRSSRSRSLALSFALGFRFETSRAPDLLPEETSKEWLGGTKSIRSAGKSLKERVKNNGFNFRDYLTDPRVGPALLLCACISWATIWFKHSQATQKNPKEEAPKDKTEKRRRPKLSTTLFGQPTSEGVDPEPKDARQWEMEDSDSD